MAMYNAQASKLVSIQPHCMKACLMPTIVYSHETRARSSNTSVPSKIYKPSKTPLSVFIIANLCRRKNDGRHFPKSPDIVSAKVSEQSKFSCAWMLQSCNDSLSTVRGQKIMHSEQGMPHFTLVELRDSNKRVALPPAWIQHAQHCSPPDNDICLDHNTTAYPEEWHGADHTYSTGRT